MFTHTDTHTHKYTQAKSIPEGQNWSLQITVFNALSLSQMATNVQKMMKVSSFEWHDLYVTLHMLRFFLVVCLLCYPHYENTQDKEHAGIFWSRLFHAQLDFLVSEIKRGTSLRILSGYF